MEAERVAWGVTQGLQVDTGTNGTSGNGTPEDGPIANETGELLETANRLLPEWVPQWSVRVALAIAVLAVA